MGGPAVPGLFGLFRWQIKKAKQYIPKPRGVNSPWSELRPVRNKGWQWVQQTNSVSFLLPVASSETSCTCRACLKTPLRPADKSAVFVHISGSRDTLVTTHRRFFPASFFLTVPFTDLNFPLPDKASAIYLCLRLCLLGSLGYCQFKKCESWEESKGCPIIMSVCHRHDMVLVQNGFLFRLSQDLLRTDHLFCETYFSL